MESPTKVIPWDNKKPLTSVPIIFIGIQKISLCKFTLFVLDLVFELKVVDIFNKAVM